jgi:hypothetical protein
MPSFEFSVIPGLPKLAFFTRHFYKYYIYIHSIYIIIALVVSNHLLLPRSEFIVGGKYRLVRKIGSGSFGDIYLGKERTPKQLFIACILCLQMLSGLYLLKTPSLSSRNIYFSYCLVVVYSSFIAIYLHFFYLSSSL